MKRIFLFFAMVVMSVVAMAQAPQKMNFQALVRNSANELVTNQAVSIEISVLNGSNTAVYTETQTVTTNANGVATLVIGEGTATKGSFAAIDWSAGNYYMQTTVNLGGGLGAVVGTSPLLSVPYALYAEKAGNAEVDLTEYAKTTDLNGYYSKAEVDSLLAALESKIGEGGGGSVATGLPELTETVVSDITVNAASFKSTINSTSGYLLNESGFCIGTSQNPTLENSIVKISYEEPDLGTYSDRIVGLQPNTTYFIRSYATNTKGTGYGTCVEFKTMASETFNYATGAIEGYFSISGSNKVAFSMGNLQYKASTGDWRFAENQYDIIGDNNSNISSTYSGYIDLFGWGTSGWNSGANAYQPYSTSTSYSDYYPGGSYSNDLTGSYANADWGVYNAISNGGNAAGMWRTLTSDEWYYVLSGRTDASSLKGSATVNGVNGMILLPDDWTTPDGITFNSGMDGFDNNTYSTSEWSKMEANGAVFLPAAGYRYSSELYNVGSYGYYWSSSLNAGSPNYAWDVGFYSSDFSRYSYFRYYGLSVRLVRGL